jgi:hypothetical protein
MGASDILLNCTWYMQVVALRGWAVHCAGDKENIRFEG